MVALMTWINFFPFSPYKSITKNNHKMNLISTKVKTSSIAIPLFLFDALQANASFISQIPDTYKGFQLKPNPYFIMEEPLLLRLVCELLERELNKREQNKYLIQECSAVKSLLVREKPFLIYVSFSANNNPFKNEKVN